MQPRKDLQAYNKTLWCSGTCNRAYLPTAEEMLSGLVTQNPDGSLSLRTTSSGSGPEANVNIAEFGGAAVTLGQKAMAASMPVVIASNQTPFAVFAQAYKASTSSYGDFQLDANNNLFTVSRSPALSAPVVTRVPVTTSTATVAAANPNRKTVIIYNDAADTILVKYGAGVTATDFTRKVVAEGETVIDDTTADISVLVATGTGNVQVTEVSYS